MERIATQSADLPLLGMLCAICANRIEKALNRAPGVEICNVNYATERATVAQSGANRCAAVARSGEKSRLRRDCTE